MATRRGELNTDRLRRRSTMDRYLETLEAPPPVEPAGEPAREPVAEPGLEPVVATVEQAGGGPEAAPVTPAPRPRRPRRTAVGPDPAPADAPRAADEGAGAPEGIGADPETATGGTAAAAPVVAAGDEPYALLNTELTPAAIKALHAAAWSDGRDGDKSPLVREAISEALDRFEALTGEERAAEVERLRRRTFEPRLVRIYRVTVSIRDRLVALNREESVPLRALPRDAIERRYGPAVEPETEPGG